MSPSQPRCTFLLLLLALALAVTGVASADDGSGSRSVEEPEQALRGPITSRAQLEAESPGSANPYLSYLPEGVAPDYRYWKAKVRFDSWDRAAATPRLRAKGGTVAESEGNDSFATAQPLPTLVAGGGPLAITGSTDSLPTVFPPVVASESGACSNESFQAPTPISLISGARLPVQGAIGDCASGAADADYYAVFLGAGDTLTVDVDVGSGPDTYAVILGEHPYSLLDVSFSDPYASPFDPDAYVSASAPVAGEYWIGIHSTSGTGGYEILIGKNTGLDIFSVELEAGDVIGVSSNIVAELSIVGPDFKDRFGSSLAWNDLYPAGSPLPTSATGSEVSDVARESGTHYIRVRSVDEFPTPYQLEAEVFRPGTEDTPPQRIFVDFDGATLDANGLFGSGPAFGNATLSPLSTFLAAWGLSGADQDELISEILATIEENLADLAALHPGLSYELLSSRDDPDPFGEPGVSRVVVGGTQAQLGRTTIGVSSAIDPGNFGLEDTAVVLLDRLSGPASEASSLNRFTLWPGRTKVELVGLGVGNIASHEIGHFLGSWHTEVQNSIYTLVDSGGDLARMIGSSDDTFGDGDDRDVDFGEDVYTPGSGIRGVEDQEGRTAFALTSATDIFADGFESGTTDAWN